MAKPPLSVDAAWQFHAAGQFGQAEQMYRQLLKKNPRHTDVMRLLGNLLRRTNRVGESLEILGRAARMRPAKANIRLEHGAALMQAGRPTDAAAEFLACVELEPDQPETRLFLGQAHLASFQIPLAIEVLEGAVQRFPTHIQLRIALGDALMVWGQMGDAETAYQAVIEQGSGNPDVLCNLGFAQRSLGKTDDARAALQACLDAQPQNGRAVAGLAELIADTGEYADAMTLLDDNISRGIQHPEMAIAYGRIAKSLKQYEKGISLLENVVRVPGLPAHYRSRLLLGLGALREANGDYDLAFSSYTEGNTLAEHHFDEDLCRRANDELMAVFDKSGLASMPRATIDTSRVIFIVGMPRSGTSLVEQVLASHPDVHGGGELQLIPAILRDMPKSVCSGAMYPTCVPELSQDAIDKISKHHVDTLTRMEPEARFVTDKLPQNFNHLGLFDVLFPGAKIIHCQRDPIDTCLSCFATRLFPAVHGYAGDLHTLGVYYNEYRRIMAHWTRVVSLPIHTVRYEQMVSNAENEIRDLLAFCDLPWHDACMNFHQSDRHTRTASVDQVKQPIYRSSVARAERFASHLGPLKAALDAFVDDG